MSARFTRFALLALLVWIVALAGPAAAGQGLPAPVAASLERPGDDAPRGIEVSAFTFDGNAGFSDAALARLLRPYTGRVLTFDELRQTVSAVLAHYRKYGYLQARVSLPPQRIENGVVRLVVDDGSLGEVALALAAPAPNTTADAESAEPARAATAAASHTKPASAARFYEALPSAKPRARVIATERRPAGRLVVELQEGPPRGFGPESDLFARLPDGGWQVGATFDMANPAGRGGHLTARGITGDEGVPTVSGRFVAPIDVAASTLDAPGRFLDEGLAEELHGPHTDGQATAIEFAAERPLLRWPAFDLSLRARTRHLDKLEEFRGTTTARRLIDTAQLSTRARLRDDFLDGGTTAASLSATLGYADLGGFEAYARKDAEGPATAGAFGRVRASLARLQSLGGPWSLFGALMAQGASKNLDGSQRFSIGGLAPERGFQVGEAFGDEGFRLNADLRYAVPAPVFGGRMQLAFFYDRGELKLRKRPDGDADNSADHQSLGLSVRQDWSGQGFVHVSAGRRIGGSLSESQESDSPYRFWLRVGMNF